MVAESYRVQLRSIRCDINCKKTYVVYDFSCAIASAPDYNSVNIAKNTPS